MINGNLSAEIQTYKSVRNAIGEQEKSWETVQTLRGFLDLMNGDCDSEKLGSRLESSTHVFVCDFVPLSKGITAENSRMIIGGEVYEITLIDNPMSLGRHYEIFLKFSGGYDEAE